MKARNMGAMSNTGLQPRNNYERSATTPVFVGFKNRREIKVMKVRIPKPTASAQDPAFPKMLHRVRTRGLAGASNPSSKKRANVFSQSRDTREDRGRRQMKTGNNPRTFTHGR
jgi:hypothetical protein